MSHNKWMNEWLTYWLTYWLNEWMDITQSAAKPFLIFLIGHTAAWTRIWSKCCALTKATKNVFTGCWTPAGDCVTLKNTDRQWRGRWKQETLSALRFSQCMILDCHWHMRWHTLYSIIFNFYLGKKPLDQFFRANSLKNRPQYLQVKVLERIFTLIRIYLEWSMT